MLHRLFHADGVRHKFKIGQDLPVMMPDVTLDRPVGQQLGRYPVSRWMYELFSINKTKADGRTNPWLSEEVLSSACAVLPLVSIDLMITRPGDQGLELLLGLHNNRPAQGWWFTPGGRIRKNEPLSTALRRVSQDEIGLNFERLSRAQLVGAWDHFYPDSAFDPGVSTRYVNLPYALHLTEGEAQAVQPPSGEGLQHRTWMWMPVAQASIDERVHEYVRMVLPRLGSE